MAIYGYTKNYKLIKPQFNTDTWHDYIYDNLDTIDAVMSAIYASGNWKGFWAKNTTYVTGDVIIDQDTDTMYKVMIDHVTSANTFAEEQTAHPDYYELWSPNNLAESWAIKTDGKVSNTDYSAKAYAISSGLIDEGSAKEWAIGSGAIGNTNEYSAKKYATDAHNDYISLTTNANIVAVSSNIANVNAVGQSISDVNTVASNISSVNVAATNIEFIKSAEGNANDAKNSKIEARNSAVTAQLMAAQAQDWATKTDGKVDGTEYSSKYYAGQASNSASNSHIWAEGTDAQVQALGGVHSSKGWAEQSTNANIALTNSPYTTNRILEIPQDIKLELNNGTLTLKAGSKVYVPNGFEADGTTPKFNVVTINSDLTSTNSFSGTYNNIAITLKTDTNSLVGDVMSTRWCSGATDTLSSLTGTHFWYDLTNNIVKLMQGTTQVTTCSFPICLTGNVGGEGFKYINKVFNGFGYIGSTVFVLPGVKVQSSTGRNADGTCTNLVHTVSSVLTYEAGHWNNTTLYFLLWTNACEGQDVRRFTRNKEFSSQSVTYSFDENENKWYFSKNNQTWNDSGFTLNIVGKFVIASGKITSFEPYTVDSVVNSNEFYQLKDKAVTTDTAQTISGSKRFTQPSAGMSIELTADTNQQTVPAEPTVRRLGLYRNATYTKGDGLTSWVHGYRGSDGWTTTELYAQRFLESDSQEIINYIKACISPDGIPVSYTKTPPANSAGKEIVTAEWVNTKLGSFANTNASNFTAERKQNVVGWEMPNYNASVEITASVAAGYTATYKQCVVVQCTKNAAQSSSATITINNISYNIATTSANNQWTESNTLFLMLDVGDTLKTNSTNAVWTIVAYPLKGA